MNEFNKHMNKFNEMMNVFNELMNYNNESEKNDMNKIIEMYIQKYPEELNELVKRAAKAAEEKAKKDLVIKTINDYDVQLNNLNASIATYHQELSIMTNKVNKLKGYLLTLQKNYKKIKNERDVYCFENNM